MTSRDRESGHVISVIVYYAHIVTKLLMSTRIHRISSLCGAAIFICFFFYYCFFFYVLDLKHTFSATHSCFLAAPYIKHSQLNALSRNILKPPFVPSNLVFFETDSIDPFESLIYALTIQLQPACGNFSHNGAPANLIFYIRFYIISGIEKLEVKVAEESL